MGPLPLPEVKDLARLMSKPMAPSELLAVAPKVEQLLVPLVSPAEAVFIMRLFRDQNLRYEPVLYGCAWKTFKAPVPNDNPQLLAELGSACAAAWQVIAQMGLTHDLQLVSLGLGRAIELLPSMRCASAVEVLDGLVNFDRQFFSLTEVSCYDDSRRLASPVTTADPLTDVEASSVVPNQPNLVELALSEFEKKIVGMSVEDLCTEWSADHLLVVLAAFAKFGVVKQETLGTVAAVAARTAMTPRQVGHVLLESVRVHSRIVDVLDEEEPEISCAPLFSMLAHRLAEMDMNRVARTDPLLILTLRKLCETNDVVTQEVPSLWNKIRGVRIAHKHSVALAAQERHRRQSGSYAQHTGVSVGRELPSSTLQRKEYAVKVQPVLRDCSKDERYVPTQFKSWRRKSFSFEGNRQKAARRQPVLKRFGTKRIVTGHCREQRKKWLKR